MMILGDSIALMKQLDANSIHLIVSDIPYGVDYEDWDVLHSNSNSALGKQSPAQQNTIFKRRGKPLNGWSKKDKTRSIEYYNWCITWAPTWFNALKPGGSSFIFAGRRNAHRCICAMEDSGFIFKDMLAWDKQHSHYKAQNVSIVFNRRNDIKNANKWLGWRLGNLMPLFEPILWFIKPYKIGGTITTNLETNELGAFNPIYQHHNIFSFKEEKKKYHPTQKPVDLLKVLIQMVTREGHIVCDPFAGSGSTLLAAKELNREYVGYEIDEKYYEVANKRLN